MAPNCSKLEDAEVPKDGLVKVNCGTPEVVAAVTPNCILGEAVVAAPGANCGKPEVVAGPDPNCPELDAVAAPNPNCGKLVDVGVVPDPNCGTLDVVVPNPNCGIVETVVVVPDPNCGTIDALVAIPDASCGLLRGLATVPEPNCGTFSMGEPKPESLSRGKLVEPPLNCIVPAVVVVVVMPLNVDDAAPNCDKGEVVVVVDFGSVGEAKAKDGETGFGVLESDF